MREASTLLPSNLLNSENKTLGPLEEAALLFHFLQHQEHNPACRLTVEEVFI